MVLHAFVAMPFGVKEGLDFDRVYSELIKPALQDAGFQVFRADEEQRAGNIRSDMFQELLLADLVVADLSIDNPNVWYELGVRHALRARGVVLVQSKRDDQPFDIYTDRKLRYHLKDGAPDPDYLEQDRVSLANMTKATAEAWQGRKISPVYKHLDYLVEPDWKSLSVTNKADTELGFNFREWEKRLVTALRRRRPGDIMLLAGEAPIQALALEAYRYAGKALMDAGQPGFALEQINKALMIAPDDTASMQVKAVVMGRLGKLEKARSLIDGLLEQDSHNAESRALLGRIEKESWIDAWRAPGQDQGAMKANAIEEVSTLAEAAAAYERAYLDDTRHYYSGVNAVTLRYVLMELSGRDKSAIPLDVLEGGVRCALASALAAELPRHKDYWARASLAEIDTLTQDPDDVRHAWEDAMVAKPDSFALDSSYQQLCILRDLGVRANAVGAALLVIEKAMRRLHKVPQPEKVFLFSGHMVDQEERDQIRFPNDSKHIEIAKQTIARQLDELQIGSGDLAICSGACGGDLLFAEAALDRGAKLELYLPYPEPVFLQKSVTFAGANWRDKYYSIKGREHTVIYIMPEELGDIPSDVNPYERNNLWQLYTALSYGAENVRFVCLWDRKEGDGPGGTRHMYDSIKNRSGQVFLLDITKLW